MFNRAATTILRSQATRKFARTPSGTLGAVRNLNVHEHVSMEIFNENGIATPKGIVAFTPEEAEAGYKNMGNRECRITV